MKVTGTVEISEAMLAMGRHIQGKKASWTELNLSSTKKIKYASLWKRSLGKTEGVATVRSQDQEHL